MEKYQDLPEELWKISEDVDKTKIDEALAELTKL